MKRTKLVIGLMLAVILLSAVPAQAEITVKLATLAPEGTVWYRAVRTVADRWSEISGGEVRMKIYPGGVMGNESAIIRKMRIDQLQAVAITSVGLGDIDPSAMVTPSLMTMIGSQSRITRFISCSITRNVTPKSLTARTI